MRRDVQDAGAKDWAAAKIARRRSAADAVGGTVSSRRCEASSATIRIDGHPEGNADPAQAHDGGGNAQKPHREKRQEQYDRQGRQRHQRAARVQEEEHDDDHHHADFFAERAKQRVANTRASFARS